MEIEHNSGEQEILIVEDSPTQAEQLKFLLQKNNYQVCVARNGREAIDLMRRQMPTIVLSDIVMPEMDGYQLCSYIKSDEAFKKIPVVLLTSLSDPGDVLKGLECGADNFMTKPYDEKILVSRLKYLIVNKHLRETDKVQMGVEIFFGGHKYFITAERQQILDLLFSTYETAVWKNIELVRVQEELKALNERLEEMVDERTAALKAEIEQRKRAEDEIRITKEKHESFFNNTSDAISIVDLNENILQVNKAFEKLYGWDSQEITGKRLPMVPEHLMADAQRIIDELKAGQVINSYETIRKGKDGSLHDVSLTVSPICDKEGNVTAYAGISRDITERKHAEETLHESEERYRTIIEHSNDMIWTLDREGNFQFINNRSEEITGYKPEDWLGKSFIPLINKEDLPYIMEVFQKTISGHILQYEVKIQRKDGSDLILSVNTAPVYSKEEIVGTVSFGRDITESRKAEEIRLENERLVYASKAKSEFLASMSHELRTPLNSVIGFSELLKEKTTGEINEKQDHYITNVITSSKFLLNLINDILDLSKVEAGKIDLVVEKISVPETLDETIILIKEKASKHNVFIKKEFDPQLKFMEADKHRLKQILFNLLSNAIKFSKKEGGTVTITTKKVKDMAQISVSDTGIGIREEDLWKLFKEFGQANPGISKEYGGTGLGLAISRKLVELHGGKIWVESKYGAGSTFTFLIPLSQEGMQ
ncbi:MAG: PAS domain S-box protein [Candidatus Methanoperedens sp.]|nr:PAS domain S-box protein [Candidatus Methanoperedens sp.]